MKLVVGEDNLPVCQAALSSGLEEYLCRVTHILSAECNVGLDSSKACSIWLKFMLDKKNT